MEIIYKPPAKYSILNVTHKRKRVYVDKAYTGVVSRTIEITFQILLL